MKKNLILVVLSLFLFMACDPGTGDEYGTVTQEIKDNLNTAFIPISSPMSERYAAAAVAASESANDSNSAKSYTLSDTGYSYNGTVQADGVGGYTDSFTVSYTNLSASGVTVNGTAQMTNTFSYSGDLFTITMTQTINLTISGAPVHSISGIINSQTVTDTKGTDESADDTVISRTTTGTYTIDGTKYRAKDFALN